MTSSIRTHRKKRAKQLRPAVCALASCGAKFTPTRKWQKFCCPAHKQEAYRRATLSNIETVLRSIVRDELRDLVQAGFVRKQIQDMIVAGYYPSAALALSGLPPRGEKVQSGGVAPSEP
jgi:hypothetical protein